MIERILALLKANHMTAKRLTELMHINTTTVTEWKKGKTKPSTEHIIMMAEIFNVTTDYLLTGKNYSFVNGRLNLNDDCLDGLDIEDLEFLDTYISRMDNSHRVRIRKLATYIAPSVDSTIY